MPADTATDASSWILSADLGADLDAHLGEPDYEAIHAAIVATEEGRWFLAQYACRNLDADMALAPEAVDSVEAKEEAERSASEVAVPAPNAQPPGLDIARLSRDLGELADALMRTRADVAAIEPPGAAGERPSILAATEALQELAWFMRERGMDPLYCDRIDGCAGDIAAACAIPDLTVQRTRAIVDVLGDLENRLHVIRAVLDGGIHGEDQFGDLGTVPAANANSPAAPKPVAIEAESVEAETIEPEMAGFASAPLAEIEPAAPSADAENTAPAGAETDLFAAPESLAEELDRYFDDQPAVADPTGTQASPRLSHLLMAAEVDRLLDTQAAAGTGANSAPVSEPLTVMAEATASVAATTSAEAVAPDQVIAPAEVAALDAALPVEATAPDAAAMPTEAIAPDEAIAPVESAPLQAASLETQSTSSEAAVAQAPVAPEPAAPPPRRVAEIAKDAFADVMALSEAERIALFS